MQHTLRGVLHVCRVGPTPYTVYVVVLRCVLTCVVDARAVSKLFDHRCRLHNKIIISILDVSYRVWVSPSSIHPRHNTATFS